MPDKALVITLEKKYLKDSKNKAQSYQGTEITKNQSENLRNKPENCETFWSALEINVEEKVYVTNR